MKPILYLDLDDTILNGGMPVHNSQAFFEWVVKHFEMRWLTAWIPNGIMDDYQAYVLSQRFDGKIPPTEFQKYNNPMPIERDDERGGSSYHKTNGIDFTETRPWAWVENRPSSAEGFILLRSGMSHKFYLTDLREGDPHAIDNPIAKTWAKLRKDFNIGE
jgi:hypothetical protein